MWADAQVWMDVAQLPGTLRLTWRRASSSASKSENVTAYFSLMTATHMHMHDSCTIAHLRTNTHLIKSWLVKKKKKKKKKSQTYIVTRSQKWGNELQIRQISLNCAIYFLPLFALLSRYLCRSKWAVKWWMIMLWWKFGGTTIALHTLRASSKHSR